MSATTIQHPVSAGWGVSAKIQLLPRLLTHPGQTLNRDHLAATLSWPFVIGLYGAFWLLDIVVVHHIGDRMPGGNPMLWAFDGALYEFSGLKSWLGYDAAAPFASGMFAFSLAWKLLVDMSLFLGPALFAVRFCGADRAAISIWVRTYLALLASCDVFLHLGMLPWLAHEAGWLTVTAQRAAVATHLLEIWVAALNAIVFGFAYQRVFRLSMQQAYLGWFGLNIVPGVLIGVAALLIFP